MVIILVAGVVGYNSDLKPYPYDPGKAKALLAEAGYPDGFSLRVDVITGFVVSDSLVYQTAAQDLAKIGVDVELRSVPFATWLGRFVRNDWGDADGFSWAWTALFYDTIRPLTRFSCTIMCSSLYIEFVFPQNFINRGGDKISPSVPLSREGFPSP